MNHQEFWIENFPELFKSVQLVPNNYMNLEEQLNTVTRFIIVIFIFLLLFNFKYDFLFLFIFLSLFFIIILYYLQKNIMQQINNRKYVKENFTNFSSQDKGPVIEYFGPTRSGVGPMLEKKPPIVSNIKYYNGIPIAGGCPATKGTFMQVDPVAANRWCNNEENLSSNFNDPSYVSNNQQLANGNSKNQGGLDRFKTTPIITPPIADLNYWQPNDFVIHSHINDEVTQDLSRSGYIVTDCQPNKIVSPQFEKCDCKNSPVDIQRGKFIYPTSSQQESIIQFPYDKNFSKQSVNPTSSQFPYDKKLSKQSVNPTSSQFPYDKNDKKENVEAYTDYFPYKTEGIPTSGCCGKGNKMCDEENCVRPSYVVDHSTPGDMITPMGYNPEQLIEHNIPSNLAVGRAEKEDVFNEYHKNIHTSIVQPGIYTRSEIIEPISANMGITFTQQFEPVTVEKDCDDGITFVSHDPRIKTLNNLPSEYKEDGPTVSNVYDPRFVGSGTGYRSYIDKLTGQPRFYYDDINAIKMPNYITRNQIDTTDFGTTYGPMNSREFCDQKDLHAKANANFLQNSLMQRTELQERLMRKINADAWQQKKMPIHKNGGSKCC